MRILVVATLVLALSSSAARAESQADLSQKTAALQKRAIAELGIGLRSIGLLLQASPNGVFRKAELQKNGDWVLLERLQKRGLVNLGANAVPGDPPPPQIEWVTFTLTPLGEAIASSAREEQPN